MEESETRMLAEAIAAEAKVEADINISPAEYESKKTR
jgi:hypothetical protein